jgi:aspartyl/asparaginyl-tRNA synthetase
MFEFESHGNIGDLFQFEIDLLTYLGFKKDYHSYSYKHFANHYDMKELTSIEENKMETDYGSVVFINQFPEYTNPFWNMSRNITGTANKIDVILNGQETIGSAERSCDKEMMRETFFTIESGKYAEKLFNTFGYDRVLSELNEFLRHDFIPRWGGGIGITRLIRSMKLNNLM